MTEQRSAGDAIPAQSGIIEVHVADTDRMFNAMDPAPFHDRDLDPNAETFIVEWSEDLPRHKPLALIVHLDRTPDIAADAALLRDSVHRFFANRAQAARRRLRDLLRRGRISLAIGLAFLAAAIGASELALQWFNPGGMIGVLRESLLIGGWVALWRPLEIFLYDWWPIRGEARLYDRLAVMPVRASEASGAAQSR